MPQCLEVLDVRWPWPLTFWSENWQPTYSCPGERYTNFDFYTYFVFELRARIGQTEWRTDRPARNAMRPIGRPHNKDVSVKRLLCTATFSQSLMVRAAVGYPGTRRVIYYTRVIFYYPILVGCMPEINKYSVVVCNSTALAPTIF